MSTPPSRPRNGDKHAATIAILPQNRRLPAREEKGGHWEEKGGHCTFHSPVAMVVCNHIQEEKGGHCTFHSPVGGKKGTLYVIIFKDNRVIRIQGGVE